MVIVFSFTPHSPLFVQKDLKEILFTTEGTEFTEKVSKGKGLVLFTLTPRCSAKRLCILCGVNIL